MNKINQKIIAVREKYLLIDCEPPAILLFIIFLFLGYFVIINKPNDVDNTFLALVASVMGFFGIRALPANNSTISLSDIVYYHLHYIYPNKAKRDEEINEFRTTNLEQTRDDVVVNLFIHDDKFKNINSDNIYTWAKTYVSETKSLLNAFIARAVYKNTVRSSFVLWSQVLPLKALTLDNARLLLLSSKASSISQFSTLRPIDRETINLAFKHYSEEDIVRLFTSPLVVKEYCQVLNFYIKYNLDLVVCHDMRELYLWTKEKASEISGAKFLLPKGILNETFTKLGMLKQIENVVKLEELGKLMANCIKTRKDDLFKQSSYLYTLSNEDEKVTIVFEITAKGLLVEAKHKANLPLCALDKEDLKQIIKDNIK